MSSEKILPMRQHTQPVAALKPLTFYVRFILAGMTLAGVQQQTPAGELPVPKAAFVTAGRADYAVAANALKIKQQTDRATLNWQSFNVGRENTVHFEQPSAAAIALNRIEQADPSRILGQIKANGQVYLLNPNGFLFGKEARIDTNTLVVSTLNLSDETFNRGVTKVVDQDGRAGLTGNGEVYRKDAAGHVLLDANGQPLKTRIEIEAGAGITAGQNGRLIFAAPAIDNAGHLTAPEGQIIMAAAADKVYLQEAGSDSKLRGLLVEVGTGGEVMQRGQLMAEHGNVTLVGFAVNQQGRVSATTSVRSAGSVKLLAREGGQSRREGEQWVIESSRTTRNEAGSDGLGKSARLVLGTGSISEATPDLNDPAMAVDGQLQDKSWMELMAHKVILQKNASLRSRSGDVTLAATENPAQVGLPATSRQNQSRIFIDEGAVIDVSGVRGVSVPMERNVVEVELRSNELRDSPLQRDGILYASKVNVDIRKGTPLADITGAIERIERTIAERSTTGGHLNLISEGDTLINPLSLLNFSGGSVAYRGGYINTTQLISQNRLYDIGEADPDRLYDGIVPTTNGSGGRHEQGYVEGKEAGRLSIKTNALLLNGTLQGGAVNGILQREPGQQARAGDLLLDLVGLRAPDDRITQPVVFSQVNNPQKRDESDGFPLDPDNPDEWQALALSPDLYQQTGIFSADIRTAGRILVPANKTVRVSPTGSLALQGGRIEVAGTIQAPSAAVHLTTRIPTTLATDEDHPLDGSIRLGSQAGLLASGIWSNQLPGKNSLPDIGPVFIQGGAVSLTAQGDIDLAAGSRIDVSGGGLHTAARQIVPGHAGTISLVAANDIGGQGSTLRVDGEMSGYALAGGQPGSIKLASSRIILRDGDSPALPGGGTDPQPLILNPEFFRRGGFGRYTLESNKEGIEVEDGTRLNLQVVNRVLDSDYTAQRSGQEMAGFTHIALLPELRRPAAELRLVLAQKVGQGNAATAIRLGRDSLIETDARGSVSVTADTRIQMDGGIEAPAGSVVLHLTTPLGAADPGFMANQTIWLGQTSSLSVAGRALVARNAQGLRQGEVLPGGHIEFRADRGFIVTEAGSLLDVSGTVTRLDLPGSGEHGAALPVSTRVPSPGGEISLKAAEGIIMRGLIRAKAGEGPGAHGGRLSLELDPRTRSEPPELAPGQTPFPSAVNYPSIIEVVDHTLAVAGLSGLKPGDSLPVEYYGRAEAQDTALIQGGLAALNLKTPDRIQWRGNVNLSLPGSLTLNAPNLMAVDHAGDAGFSAPYIALGGTETRLDDSSLRASVIRDATGGEGRLNVTAGQLDMFGLTLLKGVGDTHLASNADLRLIGVRSNPLQREYQGQLLTAGHLTLQASQVYPTTLSDFRIAITANPDGLLSVKPSGQMPAAQILSAGGQLSLEAANIMQEGVVKVPQGLLELRATQTLWLAPGSVTSNSLQFAVVPFGRTQGGLDWVYPLTGQNLVYAPQPQTDSLAPPVKSLSLTAQSLQIERGARLDTSGGGDLYAFEFVPGPGGSINSLDRFDPGYLNGRSVYQEKYAILPGYDSAYAPYDPLEYPTSGLSPGDQVYLSDSTDLKAGTYTLLPPHYALLPGAYLVSVEPNTGDMQPGQNQTTLGGDVLVAGYRKTAGTDYRDPRWSGFSLQSGAVVRTRAEFSDSYANRFFGDRAAQLEREVPLLPRDAGSIRLSAGMALTLKGTLQSRPAPGGQGGRLDIEASHLAIIAASQTHDLLQDYVYIQADDLNRLGIASIALGGVRQQTGETTRLETRASRLLIGENAQLTGSEFILTARDVITLQTGAVITTRSGDGTAPEPITQAGLYRIVGDSAFLQVSSGVDSGFVREGIRGETGSIRMDSGARMTSDGTLVIDSSLDTDLSGTLEMNGGSLTLGARRIGLGQPDSETVPGGLVLSADVLKNLKVDNLNLYSGSSLDFYPGFGGFSDNDAPATGENDPGRQNMVIRADALLGFATEGQSSVIGARRIRFENGDGGSVSHAGTGQGHLRFEAEQIEWGAGNMRFEGFDQTVFSARQEMYGTGIGQYTFASDLDLNTPVFSAGLAANTTLDAGEHAVSLSAPATTDASTPVQTQSGARLSILAHRIETATNLSLPTGSIRLRAAGGDINVNPGSRFRVVGEDSRFGDTVVSTHGGQIDLQAVRGNVNLDEGIQLDLTGRQGGQLRVSAPSGLFHLAGSIQATGTEKSGRFELVARELQADNGLNAMIDQLGQAGFSDSLSLQLDRGDYGLADVTARDFALRVEHGSIDVTGGVSLRGEDARLVLSAGNALTLSSTARLSVQGQGTHPGTVLLEAVDPNRDGSGQLTLQAGALLDLSSLNGEGAGSAVLRVGRDAAGELGFSGQVGAFAGKGGAVTLEAVRRYDFDAPSILTRHIEAWKQDTDQFMTGVVALETAIGLPGGVRPGVEVAAKGDLALGSEGWNLLDWRYDGRPGVLALVAGGDLSINGHLSDGFKAYDDTGIDLSALLGPDQVLPVKDMLQAGDSWSYRLNAGRDLTIANQTLVRTGTGHVEVNAGRDFVLGDAGSVLYTAGRPAAVNRYGTYKNAFVAYSFYGEYPIDGGNIRLHAGRDIQGAVTGQFFDGWLSRTGDWSRNPVHTGETPTAWAISLGRSDVMGDGTGLSQGIFAQNIGALGGGNVSIAAGRDIHDLSVMLPVTGKQGGEPTQPAVADDTDFNTGSITVSPGGNLNLNAGGDILGGTYYVARGTGHLVAQGAIGESPGVTGTATLLALGDSRFNLEAGGDITLGGAIDPFVVQTPDSSNFFFTYTASSGIGLTALSGNITLQNDFNTRLSALNALRSPESQLTFNATTQGALQVYPALLEAQALQGDIRLQSSLITYPSTRGRMALLAAGNILTGSTGSNVNITQSDADPGLLPTPEYPAARSFEDAAQRLDPFGRADLTHARIPLYRGVADAVRLYARNGGILPVDPLLFTLAQPVEVKAGGDIRDTSFNLQHPDYSISSMELGGDFLFTSPRNAQGNLINLTRQVQLSGPGQLWLTAGGDIDLGASKGLLTLGNTFNTALADEGASITVMSGLTTPADFAGFARVHDPVAENGRSVLVSYFRHRLDDADISEAQALAFYQTLTERERREVLIQLFFSELRRSATTAALSGLKGDYEPGFAAIESLFPGQDTTRASGQYRGDLKLFFSTLKTVDGGDINILTPGGYVNAGLAVSFSGSKAASDLGIVVQGQGQLNAFVDGDFQVNQSRVFAMGGGDITLWSSNGDIDAGRGAKAALAVPPPIVSFDEQGNLQIIYPPAVSGSGIRTASSNPAIPPGNVVLAAPRGVVDAGEAGIGGNNIVIAANAVIGASNIDVGGASVGVPTATVAVPVGAAGAAAAAASAAQTAQQSVAANNEKSQTAQTTTGKAPVLSPLEVDVIGFGDCSLSDVKEGKAGCG